MPQLSYTEFQGALLVSAGPDDLHISNLPPDVRWIVYHYTNGGYDGSGEALLAFADGTFDFANLGHCSCNSPEDDFPKAGFFSRDEILRRFGQNPNGGPLTPGEWDVDTYKSLWAGIEYLGFLNPNKEVIKRHIHSPERTLREYIIAQIIPLVAASEAEAKKYKPKAKTI